MAHHIDLTSAPIPSSSSYERGKFGRMFPNLHPCLEDTQRARLDMFNIARLMFKNGIGDDENDMPAGYTYLGQFIIHDISFDQTTINERHVDPEFLWNFRTPALDLDSVYGGGPSITPYFYDQDPDKNNGMTHFLLPEKKTSYGGEKEAFFDLPRTSSKTPIAIIADPRNDENIVISQIHAAFLQFHNAEVDRLKDDVIYKKKSELFYAAQHSVKWHYQWVVLYDYLPRILDLSEWEELMKLVKKDKESAKPKNLIKNQIEQIAKGNIEREFYDWRNEPFIPLEFSVAAFRFGHSQVRSAYMFNQDKSSNLDRTGESSIFSETPLFPTPRARVDMPSFFPKPEREKEKDKFVHNKLIGPILTGILKTIPQIQSDASDINLSKIDERNLAERNLIRGLMYRLPSGQRVARAMGLVPLDIDVNDIKQWSNNIENDFPSHLVKNTPLWYYILYEARKKQGGKRLGPVGSRIVAEVIIGLIQGDKTSFLNQDPNWVPKDKDGKEKKDFNMADLLELAGVYTP